VLPDPDDSADLYTATADEAETFGLLPYEISNYARPGSESRHNLAYWRYRDYAGIGPGAHGRVGIGDQLLATRRHRAPEPWAERVEANGHGSTEEFALSPEIRAREALLMGLRLAEGIDLAAFAGRTGQTLHESIDADTLARAIEEDYLELTATTLRALPEGRLRLDSLLAALVL